ncbi:polysaccharide pyruvyl transferase family protein [Leucobacter allii]|uniref:Polysaccharide pyruvyl transferase family protein n=1 Tax=Leucobacter allii TaxID=2932247 RepID=A0ABY4FN89_9MICO|nr:polysaccharide pyruvyl transferase family protein [Leucobacter allii]UOQ57689.1 polysaccharide pyruvyl transferase family protein [Leucobacter allii]
MKILIRAGKRPEDVLSPEAAFQRSRNGVFGANVGNLLFSNAVYRTLNVPQHSLVADALTTDKATVDAAHIARINDEFDHFAIPLANAFRPSFIPVLDRLSAVIERLDIPVTVIGVGAQLARTSGEGFEDLPASMHDSVVRFMRAVLARSAKVGVRGEFTRGYLESLGFGAEHVEVIGCPSLFEESEYRIEKRVPALTAGSALAFNAVPSVDVFGRAFALHRQRFPDLHYVQQEHRELALLMWGEPVEGGISHHFPRTVDHPVYREDRLRLFLDPAPWRAYLAERDFSFGGRIHGNIAALTAGTPAVVVSHDSRTLELAEYHRIPVVKLPETAEEIRAEALYEDADYTGFHAVQRENLERYTAFLAANGLDHIHAPGNENPGYAQELAEISYGGAVRSLHADGMDAVIGRLHWLWQGIDTDQYRLEGRFEPPFVPRRDHANWEPTPRVLRKEIDRARTETRDAERRFAELQRSAAQLETAQERLAAELEELRRLTTRRFAWIPEHSIIRRAARRIRGAGRSS